MKANEHYVLVLSFIMLCKMFHPLDSLKEIPKCDHSNESQREYIFLWYYNASVYLWHTCVNRIKLL